MTCFMCSENGVLKQANFLIDNIPAAAALLCRTISEDEAANALVCNSCERKFLEFVELQQKLASLVSSFANKKEPRQESTYDLLPPPDDGTDPHSVLGEFTEEILEAENNILASEHEEEVDQSYQLEEVYTETSIVDGTIIHDSEITVDGHLEISEEQVEFEAVETEPLNLTNPAKSSKSFTKVLEGPLQCNHCDYCAEAKSNVTNSSTMTKHLRDAHNIRVMICDICAEEFGDSIKFTDHRKLHGPLNEQSLFVCFCGASYSNARLLAVHKKMDHEICESVLSQSPTGMEFTCIQCDIKFTRRRDFDQHVKKGHLPRGKCRFCTSTFLSKLELLQHEKVHVDSMKQNSQGQPRLFKCGQCDKKFFTTSNCKKHEKTHTAVKRFPCPVCAALFTTNDSLRQHIQIHADFKPHACKTCGKHFLRRNDLEDHERVHTGERPFACEICGARFAQKSNLATHTRTTHLKEAKHKCQDCGRTFKRQRLLDCHVMAVHLNQRAFKCELCPVAYKYPEHLRKHMNSAHRSDESTYACEFCGKYFNSSVGVKTHRFVHSTKKMYECVVCGKSTMRKLILLSHMQQKGHSSNTIRLNSLSAKQEATEKKWQLVLESKEMEIESISEDVEKSSLNGNANWNVEDESEEVVVDDSGEARTSSVAGFPSSAVMEDWEKGGDAVILDGYNTFLKLIDGDDEGQSSELLEEEGVTREESSAIDMNTRSEKVARRK